MSSTGSYGPAVGIPSSPLQLPLTEGSRITLLDWSSLKIDKYAGLS